MTELEKELGMSYDEFRGMTKEQRHEKSATLTQEQIQRWNKHQSEIIRAQTWEQRNQGTYPFDVEMREMLMCSLNELGDNPENCGQWFEDYITTYPVNVSTWDDKSTTALGAYGGILNLQMLNKAIDEILETAFDKFGFMLEYIQQFEYLTPTHAMIGSAMRAKMPEFQNSSND